MYSRMAERKWPGSTPSEQLAKAVANTLLKLGYKDSVFGTPLSHPVRTEVLSSSLGGTRAIKRLCKALGEKVSKVIAGDQLPEASFQRGTDHSGKPTLCLVLSSLHGANCQVTGSMLPTATAAASAMQCAAQSSASQANTHCVSVEFLEAHAQQVICPSHSLSMSPELYSEWYWSLSTKATTHVSSCLPCWPADTLLPARSTALGKGNRHRTAALSQVKARSQAIFLLRYPGRYFARDSCLLSCWGNAAHDCCTAACHYMLMQDRMATETALANGQANSGAGPSTSAPLPVPLLAACEVPAKVTYADGLKAAAPATRHAIEVVDTDEKAVEALAEIWLHPVLAVDCESKGCTRTWHLYAIQVCSR